MLQVKKEPASPFTIKSIRKADTTAGAITGACSGAPENGSDKPPC